MFLKGNTRSDTPDLWVTEGLDGHMAAGEVSPGLEATKMYRGCSDVWGFLDKLGTNLWLRAGHTLLPSIPVCLPKVCACSVSEEALCLTRPLDFPSCCLESAF